ncbi:MAG TPA: hypothetical protein VII72_07020 [Myxococcota bacterium]|jgi:hypothetical protein
MKRALLLVVIPTLLATGCLTRTVKVPVFERDQTTVLLRSQSKGGDAIPKGFGQPITISAARMAHILSRIDMRAAEGDGQREPAIPLDSLYVIAEGMSKAFAKADPNQEVVVMSIRRGKHWVLFDRNFLNSLVAFVKDDLLYIYISRADWEIPNNLKTQLPEPRVDEQVMKFRLVASEGMTLATSQAVAVSWRDPIFRRPTRTRILPSGRVVRREILMETPEDAPAPSVSTDVLPGNLSPDTLRKLADLEEQKSRGEVTQTEYTVMRTTILQADPSFTE